VRRIATTFIVTTAGIAGAAAVAVALPAPSVTIAPVKPCYLQGDMIAVTGAGFTPGGAVDMSIDSHSLGQFGVSPAGMVGVNVTLGTMRRVKSHAVTVTDQTDKSLKATTSFLGTTNIVTFKPKKAAAGTRVQINGYGFMTTPKVYMHVRGPGYKSDARIAKPKGPCKSFAVVRRLVPFGAKPGLYRLQFDGRAKYSKKTRPRVLAKGHVRRPR
jgi:hypothetical protein